MAWKCVVCGGTNFDLTEEQITKKKGVVYDKDRYEVCSEEEECIDWSCRLSCRTCDNCIVDNWNIAEIAKWEEEELNV